MSNPWGGTKSIGSWAAEAERAEAEEPEFEPTFPTLTHTRTQTQNHTQTNPQSYPTLKESVSGKPKKKKMTLSEFYGSSSGPQDGGDVISLPTAPKPRADGEFYESGGPRLGGGFSSYSGGPLPRRTAAGGGYDDDRRGGGVPSRESQVSSRADEVDNWASAKRAFVPGHDSGRGSSGPGRYGGLGGGSRADEVDNWSLGKKVGPTSTRGGGGSSFRDMGSSVGPIWGGGGSGFRDTGSSVGPTRGVGGSSFRDTGSDWRSGPTSVDPTKPKPNPFGAARPREKVLEEKGLDWKKLDLELEVKKVGSNSGSRPTSSHGSRPSSSHSNRSENAGLGGGVDGGVEVNKSSRPKVNPFGDAKPREVLLEEKGLDWKKMDLELEHRKIDRPETEEEKALKQELENLKKKLEQPSSNEVPQDHQHEQTNIHDLIQIKEKDLETLIRELDDKARFGPKSVERPGSGPGGRASYVDRAHTQSGPGPVDEARGGDFMERSRSRGPPGDVWGSRHRDDRRGGFQGGRGGGFMNNRDFDRSRTRDRW